MIAKKKKNYYKYLGYITILIFAYLFFEIPGILLSTFIITLIDFSKKENKELKKEYES